MGSVSEAIARSARSYGVDIFTEKVKWFWLNYFGVLYILAFAFSSFFLCAYNLFLWQDVGQVLVGSDGAAKGVVLKDGTEIHSKVVLSNATPYVTFKNLTPQVLKKKTPRHHMLLWNQTI